MTRVLIPLAALALTLAACGDDPGPTTGPDSDAAAQGEILGGSINDEMLPLDGLQSQSPPMASEDDNGGQGSDDSSPAPSEPAPETDEDVEADPAPEPPAEPSEDAEPVADEG